MTEKYINPWNGLQSYSEGQHIYGRTKICNKINESILYNLQTIIYGKTGIGKTSLLQAGCFPKLRAMKFFPMIIRPGLWEDCSDYSQRLIEIIKDEVKRIIPNIKPKLFEESIIPDYISDHKVYNYLATNKFVDEKNEIHIPVLIFDQFEEFINNRKTHKYAVDFLKELYLLLDNAILPPSNGLEYSNYRLVFALREDYLYCLEDLIDHYNFDELRYNRYRIPALDDNDARNVITKTFKSAIPSLTNDSINNIINKILPLTRGKNGYSDIQTPILSLIGFLLYSEISNGIALENINIENEIYLYYDEIFSIFPLEIRDYLEKRLITIDFRRDSTDYQSALRTNIITESQINFLVNNKKVLKIAETDSEEKRIEFSHDTICRALKPIIELRNDYFEKGKNLYFKEIERKDSQGDYEKLSLYYFERSYLLGNLEAKNRIKTLYEDYAFDDVKGSVRRNKIQSILSGQSNVNIPPKDVELQYDIYICYSMVDYKEVSIVWNKFTSWGFKCSKFEKETILADSYLSTNRTMIKLSKLFVFVGSRNSYQSKWCQAELFEAEENKIPIVNVCIDTSQIPFSVQRHNSINFRDNDQKLKNYLNDILGNSLDISINNDRSWVKIDIEKYKAVFVKVDGGAFLMGATARQGGDNIDEQIVHQVSLKTYYIAIIPVIQLLWKKVVGYLPEVNCLDDYLPVTNVSWNDCQNFINKLNLLTGRKFRLATEAEWEFAARGGVKGTYNGYKYSGSNSLHTVSWFSDNSGRKLQKVAQKKSNELGIFDMSGNVWEWCEDWYGEYSSEKQLNPQGCKVGTKKVLRGGSFLSSSRDTRVTIRESEFPEEKGEDIGFRLVLEL